MTTNLTAFRQITVENVCKCGKLQKALTNLTDVKSLMLAATIKIIKKKYSTYIYIAPPSSPYYWRATTQTTRIQVL